MTQLALLAATALSAAASGAAKVKSAKYQRNSYYSQARQAELKGRSDALAYKREGIDILRNVQKTMATANVRAAAGGLAPFVSGESTSLINIASLRGAADEFSVQTDNASLAQSMSQAQADNLRQAGDVGVQMARKNAKIGFVQTMAQAGLMTGFTGNAVPMNSYSRPISVSGGQSLAGKGVL
tara:strand:+ start:52 stop:600 length:549 start_codon:yes stop_codon:yes gene_type:complete